MMQLSRAIHLNGAFFSRDMEFNNRGNESAQVPALINGAETESLHVFSFG